MSKNLIALAAVSICLAAGVRKTKDEPGKPPTIYETKPNEKVIVDPEVYKQYPDAFRDPNEDEAGGTFKDLTAKAAEKEAKAAEGAKSGSNARTTAGNGTGSNAGAKQTGLGGKDGDPTGKTGQDKETADKGGKAESDSDLTG